ncbi:cytochrome P450 [Actinacidiphila yeochonensis]|uniref:cytochrome P450 n=1 Tax=Actinacidiphila yeochonensis TaxID=89050 RepID=UPI00099E0D7E|nr:cytochrome P450 [Actinacidiphila yeochonensis]
MMRNRLSVLARASAEYGDAVRVPLGPKTLYLFNHPEHAKHVLADNAAAYHKGIGQVHARRVMGDGLLTSEGETWRRQRRTIQPVFQPKRIAKQFETIAAEATAFVATLRAAGANGPVNVSEQLTALTLGVLGRTLLDADLSAFESIGESFAAVQDQAMFEMMSLSAVPMWLPLPGQIRFRRAQRDLTRVVDQLAADRVARPGGARDDVVSRLVDANAQQPDPVAGSRRMRDELVTLLLAGHETTASTLTWAFELLDRHPDVWHRMHEEAVAVLGDQPRYEDLHRLTYTSMVVEETMRLNPPVWLLPRVAQEPDVIGGYGVPAGADVVVSPYLLHRHPDYWKEPERFDPERFAPGRSTGRERYSYIPFGAGPRYCVGSSLGLMEAVVVLATVARELRLETVPGYRVRAEPMLTLRVRGGLPMTVREAG